MGDSVAVATLLQEAGFRSVSIEPVAIEANYTRPTEFVDLQIAASAAAIPALQGLNAAQREQLIAAIRDDMAEPVRDAMESDRLRFPPRGIVARALRS